MFIPQNIKEFLDNPVGKGSSIIMNREQVRTYLDAKYNLLIDKFGDFKVSIYTKGESYFYHVIIPSESQRRNTYDVVVQFMNSTKEGEDFSNNTNVQKYHIKLFSNCPSFTYTYAYVYNEYDRMVDSLQSKYRDEVLMNPPTTRNPGEIPSYEKSTYYACKFLITHRTMLEKAYISRHSSSNFNAMIKSIRDTDTIHREINKEKRRLEREGGNEGYVKLKKKSIKGIIHNTKPNKTAGVDKTSPAKEQLKRERKATNRITPKKNSTNVIKPKAKIKPTKSSTKKGRG